jgi:hypothetical protein
MAARLAYVCSIYFEGWNIALALQIMIRKYISFLYIGVFIAGNSKLVFTSNSFISEISHTSSEYGNWERFCIACRETLS